MAIRFRPSGVRIFLPRPQDEYVMAQTCVVTRCEHCVEAQHSDIRPTDFEFDICLIPGRDFSMATAAKQDVTYVDRTESGGWVGKIIVFLIVAAVLAAGVYGSTRLLSRMKEEKKPSALVHTVMRGEMLITVTEDGNVESASNVDIKCQVAGGSSILSIISDGQEVQKGD